MTYPTFNTYSNTIEMYISELKLKNYSTSFNPYKKPFHLQPDSYSWERSIKTSQYSQPGINVHQIFMNWQEWAVTFAGCTIKHKNIPKYLIRKAKQMSFSETCTWHLDLNGFHLIRTMTFKIVPIQNIKPMCCAEILLLLQIFNSCSSLGLLCGECS